MTLKVGYAASNLILLGTFLVTVVAQLRSRGYQPFLYRAVILSTSTAGLREGQRDSIRNSDRDFCLLAIHR